MDEVTNYSYDKNGNEISQTSTKTGETLKRTYDAKNQLSTVFKEKDGQSTLVQSNDYNGDGQRIQKTEGGNTTNYYYQDGVVSSTTDGSGTQTSQNLIGLEGNVIGTERYTSDTTSYYSYNKDIQGSTTSLIKEDGTADATYTYTDFGETRIQGDNTAGNEVCYTGGVYDSTTGLYYLNARYYNPEDGRFLTEDTYRGESTEPETQNLYAYCAGNPVNYVDPSGHKGVNTSKAPPKKSGYRAPKKGARKGVAKNGKKGWVDKNGNVWVPDPSKHGGAHWDVQGKNGGYINVYPDGHTRKGSGKVNLIARKKRTIHMQIKNKYGTRNKVATVEKGMGIAFATYMLWQVTKWGLASIAAPATGGSSYFIAAVAP